MGYVAIARRYRPRVFADITGQDHVTTTLKNAIEMDRVAHAYLFAGPRGVGKTTAARILAKAINCENGPRPDPCDKCSSCAEITAGSSLDVIEIDGASNRGIDEIRGLRDGIRFAPSKGRFKVYIIDEVHMLTPEAFNALLKILEEPPRHAKFIFATTHPHKVPPTVLSRCQRFDFRAIAVKDILANLKKVSREEKIKASDEALSLIARYAQGSMRDGQVMLDQIVSFTGAGVEAEDVVKVLGLIQWETLAGLTAAISKKDVLSALKIVDGYAADGKDVAGLAAELIAFFRDLSVAKIGKDAAPLVEGGQERFKSITDIAAGYTVEEILYAIYTFSNAIDLMKSTSMPRIALEAAVIKLAGSSAIVPLEEILRRLGAAPGASIAPAARAPSAPAPAVSAPAPQNAPPSNVDDILAAWAGIISYVKARKMSVGSYLQEGYPVSLEGRTLTLGFPKDLAFHKDVLDSSDNKALIEAALKDTLKQDLRVTFTIIESAAFKGGSAPDAGPSGDDAGPDAPPESDPLIKDAINIFGGEIALRSSAKRK